MEKKCPDLQVNFNQTKKKNGTQKQNEKKKNERNTKKIMTF